MTDIKIHLNIEVSPVTLRALKKVESHIDLGYIVDSFADALLKERYREFILQPKYTSTRSGSRVALPIARKEKTQSTRVQVPCSVMQKIRRLQKRGLEISWLVEEALFFAGQRKMLPG